LHPSDQQMARGPYRRPWAESLANMKLLAREAQKRKLDASPAVQKQLALMRDQVLANAMVASVQESADDAYLRKYYDEHKQQLERVSARHVLIRTPGSQVPLRPGQAELTDAQAKAKADAVAAKLKAGGDFAAIAKADSDDEGSAADGGDLGSFTRGKMVPEFEQAVFSQKENEVGAPVKTKFGYHVIQVTGRYDSFEKLADVLRQQLAPQRTNQLVKELRGQTKIEMNDAVLGPPVPMDPADGGPPPTP
ncbi:MAG: PpiC-type peptidyl-prolyl cis-trans isomerase, partial [Phycisphaerales bacterium]|nr:PpiC-type peptidyl-prolyl cis-trans isomerase [Phycisphaerales bacterium]